MNGRKLTITPQALGMQTRWSIFVRLICSQVVNSQTAHYHLGHPFFEEFEDP